MTNKTQTLEEKFIGTYGIHEIKKRNLEKTIPKIGQKIYIPKENNYLYGLIKDEVMKVRIKKGGLVKVKSIDKHPMIDHSEYPNKLVWEMKVEVIGYHKKFILTYDWAESYKKQKILKKKYKNNLARIDEKYYDMQRELENFSDGLK